MVFKGVIIEESLADKSVLKEVKIVSTKVSKTTEKDKTPWLNQWTLHTVEVPEELADSFAQKVSNALDPEHGGSWYADYKNDWFHFIIFRGKVFKCDRKNPGDFAAPKQYGLSLGIPAHQVDFKP